MRGSPASNLKLETSNSSERGVALIVTLILLSIITFMAVTFLVVSRHGAEQVTTITQQDIAQDAAKSAVDQAEARILATMLANDNGFYMPLIVSTNYQSPFYGGSTNVADVNYLNSSGVPLAGNAYLQMLNNLLVLPRPPVFITTNFATANGKLIFPPDFRFYNDLNRNGMFDSNGPVLVEDQFGNPAVNYVGDPEWIGILEHPDQPHSRSNQFVARYCFTAQPIGNSLDINYIHNQAKESGMQNGFLRDQGVGSWEINLAGFLNGLNPNYWDYSYSPTNTQGGVNLGPSSGNAFQDADSILQFRYNGSYNTLAPFYIPPYWNPNQYNQIDFYGNGNVNGPSGLLMTGYVPTAPFSANQNVPWSGADGTNHLFDMQDWFMPQLNNTPVYPPNVLNSFSNRLAQAGVGNAPVPKFGDTNFNRYTYYRMLSQIGTDSAAETNKLNLNFINIGGISAASHVPWSALVNGQINGTNVTALFPGATITNGALAFFTEAANRLLATQPNFIITNVVVNASGQPTNTNYFTLSTAYIPIYPTNYYTPSVHRMLQQAANIYDATLNKSNNPPFDFDYPSVFRPTFNYYITNGFTNVYINGYVEVTTNTDYNNPAFAFPDDLPAFINIASNLYSGNVFGAPWVIGAKKGLPNFNQVSMQSFSQIARKVQIVKPSLAADRTTWVTNIQYVVGITNQVAVQAWNSYSSTFTRPVTVGCFDSVAMVITNENGILKSVTATNGSGLFGSGISVSNWAGYPLPPTNQNYPGLVQASFKIPMNLTTPFMPDSVYHAYGPLKNTFTIVTNASTAPFNVTPFGSPSQFPLPEFGLNVTNRLRFAIVDKASGRTIDYVQLTGMNSQRNLIAELQGNDNFGPGGLWATNRWNSTANSTDPLDGVNYQVQASLQNPPYNNPGYPSLTSADWQNALQYLPGASTVSAAVTSFGAFYNKQTNVNPQLSNQVPYTPTRQVSMFYTWQANDPLVHYTLGDLTGFGVLSTNAQPSYTYTNLVLTAINNINSRYRPWMLPQGMASDDGYCFDMTIKDPQITRSDDWQFPTNAFPNIGWLGRVPSRAPPGKPFI